MGKTLRIPALITLLPLLLALAACDNSATVTYENSHPAIEVSGEGEATLVPDMAVLQLTVLREDATAEAALAANSRAMKEVLAAMAAEGIDERDLQTSNFSIQPKFHYPKPNQGDRAEPRIVGYTVRNSLTVRVRDIERVGVILQKSVDLGVNQGGNIQFTNDDPSEALAEARSEAVRDAIARAETLAEAADVDLGDILHISENSHIPGPIPVARARMAMADEAVPVAAGENSYRVTVRMRFGIEQ